MNNVFNENSRESYYLNFNRDEIFKSLIASEGHFRNFTSLKEDTAGFLGCVVKHLADAESHADEAVSHALIAEDAETSRKFMELRDDIRKLRKWIQSSPITRDEGIREIRKIRRRFEAFNQDYDVSKCETCGDPAEVMEEITKILNDLKKTPLEVAAHEPEADEFLLMERDMAEKLIAKLSKKYGVEPPEIVISDECNEPHVGLYRDGQIMMCQSAVNLHVLAHEFFHHVQKERGKHMDEGEAEKFAIDLFEAPHQKGLYSNHEHSHNDSKMTKTLKDVGTIYAGQHAGQLAEMFLQWADIMRPEGIAGMKISLIGDILGAIGGVAGALYFKEPWDLLSALLGGHMSTDLWRFAPVPVGLPLAVPPGLVYAPPAVPPTVRAPPLMARGRYTVTG